MTADETEKYYEYYQVAKALYRAKYGRLETYKEYFDFHEMLNFKQNQQFKEEFDWILQNGMENFI